MMAGDITNKSYEDVFMVANRLCNKISETEHKQNISSVYGVPRGGVPVAIKIADILGLPLVDGPEAVGPNTLVVDDIIDSGKTRYDFKNNLFAALYSKRGNCSSMETSDTFTGYWVHTGTWVVFPWEENEETGPEDAVTRLIEFIGEDPGKEGLKDTPQRVIKSYSELFSGYNEDPADLLSTFEAESYDQLVVVKNIELYSTCEHHMMPFFGKAHVAYLPNERVIGVSKIARLVEVFARRLQIQERIGTQVVDALMKHLQPKGAGCMIEAQHFCMMARGVSKQNSVMVTSSLDGVLRDDPSAKEEFLRYVS